MQNERIGEKFGTVRNKDRTVRNKNRTEGKYGRKRILVHVRLFGNRE